MNGRVLAALLLAATPVVAQTSPDPAASPILRTSDGAILGATLAASVLLVRYDAKIIAWKGLPIFQHSERVHQTLHVFAIIGGPGSFAIDAALYGAGRVGKNKLMATDGEAALEAGAAAAIVTWAVKGIAGRARPRLDSLRADNFALGRGFREGDDYQSFPSGHSAGAFAFATALTARLSQRGSSGASWAGPTLVSLASLTALSRLYEHQHWLSDCLSGAAIGAVSGLVAVRWHERHP